LCTVWDVESRWGSEIVDPFQTSWSFVTVEAEIEAFTMLSFHGVPIESSVSMSLQSRLLTAGMHPNT